MSNRLSLKFRFGNAIVAQLVNSTAYTHLKTDYNHALMGAHEERGTYPPKKKRKIK
jgi:hypothetical protein